MPTHPEPASEPPRRRADAEYSIARILDAALDALAGDPDASMAEIARRARVVRATIYVHIPHPRGVLASTWRKLGRYHALVAITTQTHTPRRAPSTTR